MLKKFGLFALVVVVLVLGGALIVQSRDSDEPIKSPLSPLGKKLEETVQKAKYDSDLVNKNRINILLFGIDRRHKGEGYRTDIMILLSADRTTIFLGGTTLSTIPVCFKAKAFAASVCLLFITSESFTTMYCVLNSLISFLSVIAFPT